MTATLEQAQSDLLKLLNLVQQGEGVIINSQGRAVAKLSAVPPSSPSQTRQTWLARLRRLRETGVTGKTSTTTEGILGNLRSERRQMN